MMLQAFIISLKGMLLLAKYHRFEELLKFDFMLYLFNNNTANDFLVLFVHSIKR